MIPRRKPSATTQATRNHMAVITLAEAIVRAEYERAFAGLEARLAEIRKETGR